jgi:hypothetical protein
MKDQLFGIDRKGIDEFQQSPCQVFNVVLPARQYAGC